MRRTDRQMDRDSAWQAVDACCFGTVSMLLPEGEPYCVPLSIARIGETLYFHCAQEGLKLKALRKHPAVCVSCVGMAEPVHDKSGHFGRSVKSIPRRICPGSMLPLQKACPARASGGSM